MRGMNAVTGKAISGVEHLRQSINDILSTPLGSRIMLRDYGSRLFEMIDRPASSLFVSEITAAVAESLEQWEPRFSFKRLQVVDLSAGKLTLRLEGSFEGDEMSIDAELSSA